MTEIFEPSPKTLKIICARSRFNKINYSITSIMFLGVAAYIFFGNLKPETGSEYSKFAPISWLLLGIIALSFGMFFFAAIFDATEYFFDRSADKFYLTGRRNFFRKWAVEGAVSDITGVSCEVYGNDEANCSEIHFEYRFSGSLTEKINCGTGEKSVDENIANRIRIFLEPEKISA